MTAPDGKSYTGSEANPFYIFVEDNKGARFGNADEMDKIINPYITGARAYYRGVKCPGNKCFPTPEKDMNLGTTIFDLFQKL